MSTRSINGMSNDRLFFNVLYLEGGGIFPNFVFNPSPSKMF